MNIFVIVSVIVIYLYIVLLQSVWLFCGKFEIKKGKYLKFNKIWAGIWSVIPLVGITIALLFTELFVVGEKEPV